MLFLCFSLGNYFKKLTYFQMYDSFMDALIEAENDPKTVITVITGTGEYFSSGNDLKNFTRVDA